MSLILGFGLISANKVLTDKDQGTRKPGCLDFGDTCSWGGGGNFSVGQGSGNLGIDISLCDGAAGGRKVVGGGEIGGGISWTNFSAAMAIPVVCLEMVDLLLAVDLVVAVTVKVMVVEPALI